MYAVKLYQKLRSGMLIFNSWRKTTPDSESTEIYSSEISQIMSTYSELTRFIIFQFRVLE